MRGQGHLTKVRWNIRKNSFAALPSRVGLSLLSFYSFMHDSYYYPCLLSITFS